MNADLFLETMSAHVRSGKLPGLVMLVHRRGETRVDTVGAQAFGGAPMTRDSLFRITSMTKPITAAAAMILVDDGKLRLDEPVTGLLPELAGQRVLLRLDGPLDDTVPAVRAITLRDLLAARMGFGIVWGPPNATPIQRAAEELGLCAFGPPRPQVAPPPDEWMRRFATLPLMHQPGDRWMYNTSSEVLSVLVARAAGTSLEAFLHERLFLPLGMKDTSFSVPASKLARLTVGYWATNPFAPDDPGTEVFDEAAGGQWSKPPAFPSGAGGLVSTVDDYFAFGKMLTGGGVAGGKRVLSEGSVREMTSDQLSADEKARSPAVPPDYWKNHGWGYGMAVATGAREPGMPGGFGWDGGFGTTWRSDREEGLVAILMTQRAAFPPFSGVYREFWDGVYGRE